MPPGVGFRVRTAPSTGIGCGSARTSPAPSGRSIPAVPRVVARVRGLPGEFFLRAEVADALGTSPATLRRLAAKSQAMGPSGTITYGGLVVPVYDTAAVARLHAHLAEHRSPRGRPRLWADEE